MTYEELLIKSDDDGLIVKEKNIPGYGGRIWKNRIAVHDGLKTSSEKACVLAEELGHFHTTVGDINGRTDHDAVRQEHIARAYAFEMQIGVSGLVRAYQHGCRTYYDVAEYLDVPQAFLQDAMVYFRMKYGDSVQEVDGHSVRFLPDLVISPLPVTAPEEPVQTKAPVQAKTKLDPKKAARQKKRAEEARRRAAAAHRRYERYCQRLEKKLEELGPYYANEWLFNKMERERLEPPY